MQRAGVSDTGTDGCAYRCANGGAISGIASSCVLIEPNYDRQDGASSGAGGGILRLPLNIRTKRCVHVEVQDHRAAELVIAPLGARVALQILVVEVVAKIDLCDATAAWVRS